MKNEASAILQEGRKYIDPIMEANGFHWKDGRSGNSSGGFSDSGEYIKENRKLELHFRWSLGMVKYHIGESQISHENYMLHLAGKGKATYPGFSKEPLDAFKHLADDLQKYGEDFLSGDGTKLIGAVEKQKEKNKLSGFQRLSDK